MSELFLGIDIGTSGCKLALYDALGNAHGSVTEPYATHYPAPGHAEQDANDWWLAVCKGLRRLWDSGIDPKRLSALGVDGQGWAAVPIDIEGNVLANTPLWMDTRAAHSCDKWQKRLTKKRIFDVCGNPFSPTYTLPKVLHWMERDPDLIKSASHIMQSNSFIVYRLTGEVSMDFSMAYGWHNFNQTTLKYDIGLTKEFAIPERFLTAPVPSHKVVGMVNKEAARLTGLIEGMPVVAGGLDAACGTLGVGVIQSGQTQEQGGQAGGMSICLNEPLAHQSLILGSHVVPGAWLLQGGTVGGGASIKWFADNIAAKGQPYDPKLFEQLSHAAAASPAGAKGLIFLPYLSGERSPLWNTKAQGMYFGINYATAYEDFIRATMEGAAYALRHNIDCALEAGAHVGRMHATGGSANSHVWTQIKADVTGLPIAVPASDSAATCGAAMLAMVGAGCYGDFPQAVKAIVKIKRAHSPNKSHFRVYTALYEQYRSLYENTVANMEALCHIKETLLQEL